MAEMPRTIPVNVTLDPKTVLEMQLTMVRAAAEFNHSMARHFRDMGIQLADRASKIQIELNAIKRAEKKAEEKN